MDNWHLEGYGQLKHKVQLSASDIDASFYHEVFLETQVQSNVNSTMGGWHPPSTNPNIFPQATPLPPASSAEDLKLVQPESARSYAFFI